MSGTAGQKDYRVGGFKWNRTILPVLAAPILLLSATIFTTMKQAGWAEGLIVKRSLPRGPQREVAKGVFLVADPRLIDPNFSKTVVLVIHHGSDGTMGVIINRPTSTRLAGLLPEIKELKERPDVLYIGGPVLHEVLLLLLRSQASLQSADQVLDQVYFSQSFDMLAALLKENRPKDAFHVFAGYAGWAAGQLQAEFDRGDWRIIQGDPDTIFIKDPAAIWSEMIRRSSEQLIKDGHGLHPLTALE